MLRLPCLGAPIHEFWEEKILWWWDEQTCVALWYSIGFETERNLSRAKTTVVKMLATMAMLLTWKYQRKHSLKIPFLKCPSGPKILGRLSFSYVRKYLPSNYLVHRWKRGAPFPPGQKQHPPLMKNYTSPFEWSWHPPPFFVPGQNLHDMWKHLDCLILDLKETIYENFACGLLTFTFRTGVWSKKLIKKFTQKINRSSSCYMRLSLWLYTEKFKA